jgi:O-antigen ligase
MALQRTILLGLVALIVLAPLPFGSVETWSRSCLAGACLGLGLLWVIGRRRSGLPPLPWKDPVLLAGALFMTVGVAQSIPVPRPVLQSLSPRAVDIRDRYEAPAEPRSIAQQGRPRPFAGSRPISLDPWATRRAILWFMALLLVVLITIDLAAQDFSRRALVAGLVLSGGFQAIYGLVEYVTSRQQIFGYAKRFYTDVATGTFINRNHFAGYLAMTMPLAIALASGFAVRLRGGGRPDRETDPVMTSGRDLYLASALLMLALTMATALAASQSRMGILSAFLSIMAASLFIIWRSRQMAYAIASLLLAGGTVMVLLQGQVGRAIVERFAVLNDSMQSIVGRGKIWSETIALGKEFPWLGIGWGAYPAVIPAFRDGGLGSSYDHAHNDYLELFAEAGWLGCAVALAGVVLILLPIVRKPAARPDYGLLGFGVAAGVVAIGLHSLTDFNLAIPANALTFSVLVGLLIAWRRIPAPALAPQRTGYRPVIEWRTSSAVVILGIAALSALAPALPYARRPPASPAIDDDGARDPELSEQRLGLLLDGGNPERLLRAGASVGRHAQADMQALIELNPQGPFSNITMDYIEQRLQTAGELVSQSIRQLPTSAPGHLVLADLSVSRCALASLVAQTELDCMAPAVAELTAAVEVNPMSAMTHGKAAKLYLAAWPMLKEEARSRAGDVIRVALSSPRRDSDLLDAAVRRGFQP